MIQQIMLVVLILHAIMKWSKRPGKGDRDRKVCSNALPISGCSPCRDVGCLLALAGQYKPPTRLPFLGLPSVITWHCEIAEQGSSLALHRACHSFTQKMKQKMCILRKQRGLSSECSYLLLKILDGSQYDTLWWTVSDS